MDTKHLLMIGMTTAMLAIPQTAFANMDYDSFYNQYIQEEIGHMTELERSAVIQYLANDALSNQKTVDKRKQS